MIDQDPARSGGQLIILRRLVVVCLGSPARRCRNALGTWDTRPTHTAPLFAGDTVFAATEILGKHDLPGRPDLGEVETRLFGHKFVRKSASPGPEPNFEKVEIFELDRDVVVKRRSHYA